MRKILVVLSTIALSIAAAIAVPVSANAASKGYKSTIKLEGVDVNSIETVYSDTKSEIQVVDGFLYDKDANTLYVCNVTRSGIVIKAENMGELIVTFWGDNELAGISTTGGKYSKTTVSASLTISGAGNVKLNEKGLLTHAIEIDANKTDSVYKCGRYINMVAKGVDTAAAVSVTKSTNKKPIQYIAKGLNIDPNASEVNVTGKACTKHFYYLIGNVETPSDQFTKGKADMTCEVCGHTEVKKIPRIAKVRLSAYGFKYDGKAKKPSIEVINENDKPISSRYYTVSYKDNVNKTTKYKMAKVIITFKGPYTGKITKNFAIG